MNHKKQQQARRAKERETAKQPKQPRKAQQMELVFIDTETSTVEPGQSMTFLLVLEQHTAERLIINGAATGCTIDYVETERRRFDLACPVEVFGELADPVDIGAWRLSGRVEVKIDNPTSEPRIVEVRLVYPAEALP